VSKCGGQARQSQELDAAVRARARDEAAARLELDAPPTLDLRGPGSPSSSSCIRAWLPQSMHLTSERKQPRAARSPRGLASSTLTEPVSATCTRCYATSYLAGSAFAQRGATFSERRLFGGAVSRRPSRPHRSPAKLARRESSSRRSSRSPALAPAMSLRTVLTIAGSGASLPQVCGPGEPSLTRLT